MANERMHPILPCRDWDEAIAFYEALGFARCPATFTDQDRSALGAVFGPSAQSIWSGMCPGVTA